MRAWVVLLACLSELVWAERWAVGEGREGSEEGSEKAPRNGDKNDNLHPPCEAWTLLQEMMWEAVEYRTLPTHLPQQFQELLGVAEATVGVSEQLLQCPFGAATVLAIFAAVDPHMFKHVLEEFLFVVFEIPEVFPELICSGFPLFGALDWVEQTEKQTVCEQESKTFYLSLAHYLGRSRESPPALSTVAFLEDLPEECLTERAVGWLSLGLSLLESGLQEASESNLHFSSSSPTSCLLPQELRDSLQKAEALLRDESESEREKLGNYRQIESQSSHPSPILHRLLSPWPLKVLHQMARKWKESKESQSVPSTDFEDEDEGDREDDDDDDCLILIYTFPTEEIRQDVAEALRSLEEYVVNPLREEGEESIERGKGRRELPKLVVFVDSDTAEKLNELKPYTSLEIRPAIIPEEELSREMKSYSCQNGDLCASGEELPKDFHRGNFNETQFWSPAYLRISRYTAGPLFQHPALDSCGVFLKIDTDFFFTAPIQTNPNPFRKMRREAVRLGYWQIHIQGQRQTGYMEAALRFLQAGGEG